MLKKKKVDFVRFWSWFFVIILKCVHLLTSLCYIYADIWGVFFVPLSQVSFKTKILLCNCQATNVVGLGTSIVMQYKAEWRGSVIRLLMKGQKRTPLGMYIADACLRN